MKFNRLHLQSLPNPSAKGLHCIRPTTRITHATFHRKRNACEIHALAWARTDFSGQRANGSGHRNSSAKYFWLTQMSELSTSSEAKRMAVGVERGGGAGGGVWRGLVSTLSEATDHKALPQRRPHCSLCAPHWTRLYWPPPPVTATVTSPTLLLPLAPCPHSLTVLKKLLKIACHAFYFHWAPQLLPSGQKKKN